MKIRQILFFAVLTFTSLIGCGSEIRNEQNKENPVKSDDFKVFYEANPRVFENAALDAITLRLDNIKALGTDVLWLMPIYQQGSVKAVGSPYCVRNYEMVNPDFGTLQDLQELVKAAHGKGMKVMLDWVANHTSWDNAWINEHPDWYTEDASGNIISPAGMGWNDVADLNFDNKEMRKAMIASMLYWVKNADIDGFRCDYADGVPADFWKEAITELRSAKSGLLMLAESADEKFFASGFDIIYGWPYQTALQKLFSNADVNAFYTSVSQENKKLYEGKHIMRFTTNHDKASEKSPVSVYNTKEGAMAAFVITSFIGEYPLVYSSQEVAWPKALTFFSNVSIDWDSAPLYTKAYQDILKISKETSAMRTVEPKFYSSGKLVVMYYPDGLFIVVNPTSEAVSVKAPIERFGDKVTDLISGKQETVPAMLELGGYEYKIWKKQ